MRGLLAAIAAACAAVCAGVAVKVARDRNGEKELMSQRKWV